MKIQVTCPSCSRRYSVDQDEAGKRLKCQCGELLQVPRGAAPPPSRAAAPAAKRNPPSAAPTPKPASQAAAPPPKPAAKAAAPPPKPAASGGPAITTHAPSPTARYARKKSSPVVLIVAVIGVVGIVMLLAVVGGLYFLMGDGANVIASGAGGSVGAEENSGSGTGGTSSNRSGKPGDADYFILLVDPNIEKDLGVRGAGAAGIARLREEHLVKLREKAAARFRSEAGSRMPIPPPRGQSNLSAGARIELWNEHMEIYGAKVRNLLSEGERAKLKQMYDTGRIKRMEAMPGGASGSPSGWGGVTIPPGSDVRVGPGGAVIVNQPLPTGAGVLPMKKSGPVSFRDMDVSGDGKLVGATYGRFTKFWSLPGRLEMPDLKHELHDAGRTIAISPDGKHVAIGHAREGVTVFDTGTWKLVAQMKDDSDAKLDVTDIHYSRDGNWLAAPITHHKITVWDTRTYETRREVTTDVPRMQCVAISPDGSYLATSDSGVKVWDVDTGELRHTLNANGAYVKSLAFSPDGSTLAVGAARHSNPKGVWLFDVRSGNRKSRLDAPATAIDFSADGRQLLAALWVPSGQEGLVQLWDVETQKVVAEFPQPKHQTNNAVRFLPDGKSFLVLRSGLGASGSVKLHEL